VFACIHRAAEATLDQDDHPLGVDGDIVGSGSVGQLEHHALAVPAHPDSSVRIEPRRCRGGRMEDLESAFGEGDHHTSLRRVTLPAMSDAPIELPLRGAGGEPVDLWRTLNSHGFAELPPLRVDEDARNLELTVRMPRGKPRRVLIQQGRPGFAQILPISGGTPSRTSAGAIEDAVAHVLRLDQDLSSFYADASEDPDLSWVTAGAGRMLRSATVWEDVVKTICTTNCSWSLTTTMVRALVTHLGEPVARSREPLTNAFPTAAAMAEQDERFYRQVVRAGYRAPSLVRVSKMVTAGQVDLEALASADDSLPDDEVERRLLDLPGVGPYAAAHIMMTLGRNSRLILDSWTRPTYARLIGRRKVPSDAAISRRFRRFGSSAGLAFWLFVTSDWVNDRPAAPASVPEVVPR
jgi:3-methyladenine DNA glycosylase/8-oxoguanine DNA glycosylase